MRTESPVRTEREIIETVATMRAGGDALILSFFNRLACCLGLA